MIDIVGLTPKDYCVASEIQYHNQSSQKFGVLTETTTIGNYLITHNLNNQDKETRELKEMKGVPPTPWEIKYQ